MGKHFTDIFVTDSVKEQDPFDKEEIKVQQVTMIQVND